MIKILIVIFFQNIHGVIKVNIIRIKEIVETWSQHPTMILGTGLIEDGNNEFDNSNR